MDAVFLELLKLSATGSLFVLAVLILRGLFRKAPKWVFCLLWGMVAIHLTVPVSVESSFAILPDTLTEGEALTKLTDTYLEDVEYIYEGSRDYALAVESGCKIVHGDGDVYVVTGKDSLSAPATVENTLIPVLSRVWFAGAAVMVLYMLLSFFSLKRRIATATVLRGNIRQSEQVSSPFVLGIIRPVIYLPYGLREADMDNVIAHEMAHIKRKDHWWKPVGFLILSVYWFNPVMWLAYILLCRDIEAACDEKVIRSMDKAGIQAYSTALLNCSIHRRGIAACPLAFGEVGVKERIRRVMDYKKPAFWLVILAVAVSVAAAVMLLTVPVTKDMPLMGAYYSVEELLYTNKQEATQVYSRYCITADQRLYAQKQGADYWVLGRQMEPYDLSAARLEGFADYRNGWHTRYDVKKVTDAWIARVENGFCYLAVQTKTGDTLLGFGQEDASGDISLRYLYTLRSEYDPEKPDLGFLDLSLSEPAGIASCFEAFAPQEHPGFMVVGFLAGHDGSYPHVYDDMGYAVLQTNERGCRLLRWQVYENAAREENGIYFCDDPAVLSLDGEITDTDSYDVILSCSKELDKIVREYYRDDQLVLSCASQQEGLMSMTLFRWDLCRDADRVSQVYLDKNGDPIQVTTTADKVLALVDEIVYNPEAAVSSNPYDFIQARQHAYFQLISYGNRALTVLTRELRESPDDGLREYIMAAACAELTGFGQNKNHTPWASGKEWLRLYEYEQSRGGEILGTEDTAGAMIAVDSLLGIDCAAMRIVAVEDHPYKQGVHRYSYRFQYYGNGTSYDWDGQEMYLMEIHSCLDIKMGDFDLDGIVELFYYTDTEEYPYYICDRVGGTLVETGYTLVPDEVMDYELLLNNDLYYLYEERWAWFLKDPLAYIREVKKLPQERLYFSGPDGAIPAATDPALVREAYQILVDYASGELSTYEKKILYKLMTTMELSYTPELVAGQINYVVLFEKWGFTLSSSSEEENCYRQMVHCFAIDPVGFVKGMVERKEFPWPKDMSLAAGRIAHVNFLYNAAAFDAELRRLESVNLNAEEMKMAALLRECFEIWEAPALDREALLEATGEELWYAFYFAPDQVLDTLASIYNTTDGNTAGFRNRLFYKMPYKDEILMEKCAVAIDRLLSQNPTQAQKNAAYPFLMCMELLGGYRDVRAPGEPYEYKKLFDKLTYADGAFGELYMDQAGQIFEENPATFFQELTAWVQTDGQRRIIDNLAVSFAHRFLSSEDYLKILFGLADGMQETNQRDMVLDFIDAYQTIRLTAE